MTAYDSLLILFSVGPKTSNIIECLSMNSKFWYFVQSWNNIKTSTCFEAVLISPRVNLQYSSVCRIFISHGLATRCQQNVIHSLCREGRICGGLRFLKTMT